MCFRRLLVVTQIVEYAPRQFTVSEKKDPIKLLSYFRIVAWPLLSVFFLLIAEGSNVIELVVAFSRVQATREPNEKPANDAQQSHSRFRYMLQF